MKLVSNVNTSCRHYCRDANLQQKNYPFFTLFILYTSVFDIKVVKEEKSENGKYQLRVDIIASLPKSQ